MAERKDHITFAQFLRGLRDDMDAALDGAPSVMFRLKLDTKAAVFTNTAGDRIIDFDEGKMNTTLALEVEPSEITVARIRAQARVEELRILQAAGAAGDDH